MSQTISKLQQLCDYLCQGMNPYVKPNDIDGWQGGGQLMINTEDLGLNGCLLAKWKYDAVIEIERLPHRKVNPYNLLGMIAVWLIEEDADRDDYGLSDPDLDITVISKDHAQVTIELDLIDDIELVPDEQGPIRYLGERYRISLVPINIAESAELQTKDAD